MSDKLPLSSIIEVALQRATSHEQMEHVLSLAEAILHLEQCFAADSAADR